MAVSIRYIGDAEPAPHFLKNAIEIIGKEEFPGLPVDFDHVLAAKAGMARDIGLARIQADEAWMQFDALVIDMYFTHDSTIPTNVAKIAGLEIVFDGIVNGYKRLNNSTPGVDANAPLPWKDVFIATVWLEMAQDDPTRTQILGEAANRGIPETNIFGAAGGVDGFKRLARAILTRFAP